MPVGVTGSRRPGVDLKLVHGGCDEGAERGARLDLLAEVAVVALAVISVSRSGAASRVRTA